MEINRIGSFPACSETIIIKSCFPGSFLRESEALNDFDTVLRIWSIRVHVFRKHGNNLVINNRGRNTINVLMVSLNFNFAHNSTPNHKPITNATQRNPPEINCNHPCNMATYNCVSNIESKIASVLLNKAVRLVRK